jgi:hypothetical protein
MLWLRSPRSSGRSGIEAPGDVLELLRGLAQALDARVHVRAELLARGAARGDLADPARQLLGDPANVGAGRSEKVRVVAHAMVFSIHGLTPLGRPT